MGDDWTCTHDAFTCTGEAFDLHCTMGGDWTCTGDGWTCTGPAFDFHCTKDGDKRSVPISPDGKADILLHVFVCTLVFVLFLCILHALVWARRLERAKMNSGALGRGGEDGKAYAGMLV